jgi:hypothetical protein
MKQRVSMAQHRDWLPMFASRTLVLSVVSGGRCVSAFGTPLSIEKRRESVMNWTLEVVTVSLP